MDYSITGTLAQFSREGIVRALAEQLTRQFADNLQARLPQGGSAAAAPPAAAAAATPPGQVAIAAAPGPTPRAAPAPARADPRADPSTIDLWTLFKAWMRGLFAGRS